MVDGFSNSNRIPFRTDKNNLKAASHVKLLHSWLTVAIDDWLMRIKVMFKWKSNWKISHGNHLTECCSHKNLVADKWWLAELLVTYSTSLYFAKIKSSSRSRHRFHELTLLLSGPIRKIASQIGSNTATLALSLMDHWQKYQVYVADNL